jgi:hypothetical protein
MILYKKALTKTKREFKMKRFMLFASALALAACSNGGSSGSAPAGNIPGQIGNHPVSNKVALTGNQKATIKNFSTKMEKMPDASLFLPSQNESSSERQERYDKISKLSPEGKLNYDKIQNNCQFQVPQQNGSQQSSTITTSIGGNGCPIRFSQTVRNESSGQPVGGKSTFKSTTSGDMSILDPSMQAQVGFTKSTVNFTMNGTFMGSEQSSSTYMSGTGNITLQTVNGQNASMTMTYEMLSGSGKMSSYTEMSFTLDSISATVQAYVEYTQGSASQRFFLNGQPTTETELKQIFGDNFSAGVSQN